MEGSGETVGQRSGVEAGQAAAGEEPRAVSLLALAWVFLKVGVTGIGDMPPLLAYIERELIDGRRVVTRKDLTDSMTYTKVLPGSTVIQIVAYLAYKLRGWPGSAIATAAYILPSAVAMAALAAGYVSTTALPAVGPALSGLTAAVVGILLATAYRLGKRNIDPKEPLTVGIALAAFLAGAFLDANAALLVVGGGFLGVLALSDQTGQGETVKEARR
ncbi:MAG TPA: chromate transporter [Chloroflexota bacterium]|nr:chromate transporter [Chloroflexota bacterium]